MKSKQGTGERDILLSEATRSQLTAEDTLEALPAVRVKGKSVEVSIYRAA